MKEMNQNIAANIKKYMDALEIETKELADRLDCAPSTVYMWTQGNSTPRMDKIDRMCEVFGCTRNDIVSDTPKSEDEIRQDFLVVTFTKKFKLLSKENQLRVLAFMEGMEGVEK